MHRQTHHPLRHCISHGQLHVVVGHCGLFVEGDGVVHGSGDAGLFELFLQGFAVGYLDGVLGPSAGVVGFQVGELDLPFDRLRANGVCAQQTVVCIGHSLTLGEFFV